MNKADFQYIKFNKDHEAQVDQRSEEYGPPCLSFADTKNSHLGVKTNKVKPVDAIRSVTDFNSSIERRFPGGKAFAARTDTYNTHETLRRVQEQNPGWVQSIPDGTSVTRALALAREKLGIEIKTDLSTAIKKGKAAASEKKRKVPK